jgi:hypothetical protein
MTFVIEYPEYDLLKLKSGRKVKSLKTEVVTTRWGSRYESPTEAWEDDYISADDYRMISNGNFPSAFINIYNVYGEVVEIRPVKGQSFSFAEDCI